MILGIDEAGRGPVIGPLVMAGVFCTDEELTKMEALGVKDSKLLSVKRREELYDQIVQIGKYEILIVSPAEVDNSLKVSNLNWLEADKIVALWELFRPKKVIADCPSTNISSFTEYVRNRIDNRTELVFEHKADENYPIVSAASILAKVTRDRSIATLRSIYGDFGSGYQTDPKTQEFLKHHHDLPIFRKSWMTWKRVNEEKHQKRLFDY